MQEKTKRRIATIGFSTLFIGGIFSIIYFPFRKKYPKGSLTFGVIGASIAGYIVYQLFTSPFFGSVGPSDSGRPPENFTPQS